MYKMISLNTDTIKVKENNQWQSLASLTGPKGDKGDTGATGSQGPQGIPGVPGYPTIQAGDAGKVLTVNSLESGVEWDTLIGGLNVLHSGNPYDWVISQEEKAAYELGKSAVVIDDKLYIYSKKDTWDFGDHIEYNYVFCSPADGAQGNGWNSAVDTPQWSINSNAGSQFNYGTDGRGLWNEDPQNNWGDTAQQGDIQDFHLVSRATREDGWTSIQYNWEEIQGGGGGGLTVIEASSNYVLTDDEMATLVANPANVVLHISNDRRYYYCAKEPNNVTDYDYTFISPYQDSSNQTSGSISWAQYKIETRSANANYKKVRWQARAMYLLPSTNASAANKALKVNSSGNGYELGDAVPIAPPSTQGTYTLQVSVDAQGNPTYSWV